MKISPLYDGETVRKKFEKVKEQIEKCDVLIVVICSDSNPDGEDVSAGKHEEG